MKYFLIGLTILCPCIGYSVGYGGNNSCYNCAAIEIEYLFLKPSIHDPFFVVPLEDFVDESEQPNGTRSGNLWPYHSGVRMRGVYKLPCTQLDLYGEGLYFQDQEKRSISFGTGQDGAATKGHGDLESSSI